MPVFWFPCSKNIAILRGVAITLCGSLMVEDFIARWIQDAH